ncbi:CRISPR-associated protein Cas4 [Caldinitratiruptor microaerophilus]|uniref:CRISPR-associated protein Cas4 n=1 Tax=Caldinitratiruptor microaerophilus TaxID=671077 RepID=UPI00222F1711|nr:CRISPR-associated protein Cas4 [Caldinitratiruptor microaerophilus]
MVTGAVPDEYWVPISALQHYSYCPRQCALIHLEQTFDENLYTLRGRAVHERVDVPGVAVEAGVRIERGLVLWSDRLGLVGKADVVEFHGEVPYPVEYKHGSRRASEHDDLQLCAQALCLEEMLGVPVPRGAIYHHSSRHRREVVFTPELRERVTVVLQEVRALLSARLLPPAVNDTRCPRCSLIDSCLPRPVQDRRRIEDLLQEVFNTGLEEGETSA